MAFEHLHVEPDRQQVPHVERVHHHVGRLQVFVELDLDPVVLVAETLALLENVVFGFVLTTVLIFIGRSYGYFDEITALSKSS